MKNGSGVISKSNSGVPGQLGVGDHVDRLSISGDAIIGSCRMRNLLNSRPSGEGRCFDALMNGVPSGFLFRVRPGFPCFLETPYTHCEPLALQRAQIGCSLLHLTLEAAHASHEARSLGLRSVFDLGADVGIDRRGVAGAEVGRPWVSDGCHSGVCDLKSIVLTICVIVTNSPLVNLLECGVWSLWSV
jgi:hypothetical protein